MPSPWLSKGFSPVRKLGPEVVVHQVHGFSRIRNERPSLLPKAKVPDRSAEQLAQQMWEDAGRLGADERLLGKAAVLSHEYQKLGKRCPTSTAYVLSEIIEVGRMNLGAAAAMLCVDVPTLHQYLDGDRIAETLEGLSQASSFVALVIPDTSRGKRLAQDLPAAWILDSLRAAYGNDLHFGAAMALLKELFFQQESSCQSPSQGSSANSFQGSEPNGHSQGTAVYDGTHSKPTKEEAFAMRQWRAYVNLLDRSGSFSEYRLQAKKLRPADVAIFNTIASANAPAEVRYGAAELYGLFGKSTFFPAALEVIRLDQWDLKGLIPHYLSTILDVYQKFADSQTLNKTLEKMERHLKGLLGERWETECKVVNPKLLQRLVHVLIDRLEFIQPEAFLTAGLVDILKSRYPDRNHLKPSAEIALIGNHNNATEIARNVLCDMLWKRMMKERIGQDQAEAFLGFPPSPFFLEFLKA